MTDTPPDWVLKEAAKRCAWPLNKTLAQLRGYLASSASFTELCRAIEQHEAFRQEVSDVASVCAQHFCENSWTVGDRQDHVDMLSRFIIPKPKPDPLEDVAESMGYYGDDAIDLAEEIRAALDAIGFEIKEKNNV